MDRENQDRPALGGDASRRRFLGKLATAAAATALAGSCTSTPPRADAPRAGKILGRCGYRCDLCAARSDDPAVRQKLVDAWRKWWGHENYTAENVKCGGCSAEQRADMNCAVRPCVIEKGLPNCAYCDECPCDKLKELCSSAHLNFLRFGDVPADEYNLALRQFDNIPELMAIRRELKKKGMR